MASRRAWMSMECLSAIGLVISYTLGSIPAGLQNFLVVG
jgi:hypothetical protein